MAKRRIIPESDPPSTVSDDGGLYFSRREVETFSSGCSLLDCVLGGGWAMNRILNLVGDRSTGKTLLAIEAAANFAVAYPKGEIHYIEAEAAFDRGYAEMLGLPSSGVVFPNGELDPDGPYPEGIFTVEALFKYFTELCKEATENVLVIVDSLDAISDEAEMERGMTSATFGASKAKALSQMFRQITSLLNRSKVTVMVISQVRENIGVAFGEKHTRSGGKALDFYASQILWLRQKKILKRTRQLVERSYGLLIESNCKKNKVGPPHRKCEFPLLYSFGVDDIVAGVDWLLSIKQAGVLFDSDAEAKKFVRGIDKLSADAYLEERDAVATAVREVWDSIEKRHAPGRSKYG